MSYLYTFSPLHSHPKHQFFFSYSLISLGIRLPSIPNTFTNYIINSMIPNPNLQHTLEFHNTYHHFTNFTYTHITSFRRFLNIHIIISQFYITTPSSLPMVGFPSPSPMEVRLKQGRTLTFLSNI